MYVSDKLLEIVLKSRILRHACCGKISFCTRKSYLTSLLEVFEKVKSMWAMVTRRIFRRCLMRYLTQNF